MIPSRDTIFMMGKIFAFRSTAPVAVSDSAAVSSARNATDICRAPADAGTTWGYARSDSAREFAERYQRLLATIRSLSLFAGFCYTQFADTYQESNGLLYADRTPKFPLDEIAAATRG